MSAQADLENHIRVNGAFLTAANGAAYEERQRLTALAAGPEEVLIRDSEVTPEVIIEEKPVAEVDTKSEQRDE